MDFRAGRKLRRANANIRDNVVLLADYKTARSFRRVGARQEPRPTRWTRFEKFPAQNLRISEIAIPARGTEMRAEKFRKSGNPLFAQRFNGPGHSWPLAGDTPVNGN